MLDLKIRAMGDTGFLIRDEARIDPVINARIQRLKLLIDKQNIPGVIECIPAYSDLLVRYDQTVLKNTVLYQKLLTVIGQVDELALESGRQIEIPVCYGGEFGPDLEDLANALQCTQAEIIQRHSSQEYRVYMLGFTPGFAYMGGLDPFLAFPRKARPSPLIRAGSVGIADQQTGIYPLDSPGGWQIIGRTPRCLFDLAKKNPFLLQAGDRISFKAISYEQFEELKNA